MHRNNRDHLFGRGQTGCRSRRVFRAGLLVATALAVLTSGACKRGHDGSGERQKAPPPSAELKATDLCAGNGDTKKFLRALAARGGENAVADWFNTHVAVPCNVQVCIDGKKKTLPRVVTIYVQKVRNRGVAKRLLRLGPDTRTAKLAPGVQTMTVNSFPSFGKDVEGIGVAFYYYPEAN